MVHVDHGVGRYRGLEIVQAFIPGRGTEGLDMVVNGLGAAAFGWIGSRWL